MSVERDRIPVFSNRYIVQKATLKSSAARKHVIDGKRNCSLESVDRFTGALKIEGILCHNFPTRVLFNQAFTKEEREKYLRMISKCSMLQ